MSVTAKPLITAQYSAAAATVYYTAPASTKTIIDKFTATNQHGSTQTVTVHIVPAAGSATAANIIVKARSISAGATSDVTELQNQVLGAGETIHVLASVPDFVVIRASGRECT